MAKASDKTAAAQDNPKANPTDASNQIKDPDQWTTGGEPMTGAQASYLKTLSEQAKAPWSSWSRSAASAYTVPR